MSVVAATTPNKPLNGTNGQVFITISSVMTEFQVTKAEWTYDPGKEDITHSGANGWQVLMPNIRKVTGSVTYIYDLANSPFATPYGLKGAATANLNLIQNAHQGANLVTGDASSSEAWAGPAFIANHKLSTGPSVGKLECSFDFESSGAWTGPGIA